ncbi:MAG: glycosyltransferase family 4 protein [Chitinophagales bacterium]|nr:glycosyltransferase family 4 protein [Chitinophagales bacterium]
MIIGLDAKRIYNNSTGLGSYGRNLVHYLIKWYPQNDYKLLVHNDYYKPSPYKYTAFRDKTITSDHFLPNLWRSTEIAKDIVKNNIEIFHGISNELPFALPKTVKTVTTIHDIIFHKFPDYFPLLDRQVYKYKVKRACTEANAIVAVSENTRNDLVNDFKIDANKIFIINPSWGREFEFEYTNWFNEFLRLKYSLPFDFLLFVGAVSKRKNLYTVIRALELPENVEISLVVVSDGGDNYYEIEDYVATREVGHRVFFLNNLPSYELPGIYGMAKCLVYPSFYEGFGMPIIESLKMGTPVIASDTSSLKEAGGSGAIYLKPDDVEAWADTINNVVLDRELNEKLILNGAEYIKRFKPEVTTTAMIDLYSWLHENYL